MYKIIRENDEKKRAEIKELFGGYNDFPPGWEEISVDELVKSRMLGMEDYIDRRQMKKSDVVAGQKIERGFIGATLYIISKKGCGYAVVDDYWAGEIHYFKFNIFEELKKSFNELPIQDDSEWKLNKETSIPLRGIRDYDRVVQFHRPLTGDEIKKTIMYLLKDKCPGWTGIKVIGINDKTYKFSTTYDSSD